MTSVVGIDLSSRAVDLAALDETTGHATHTRISLERDKRATAWERTLALPELMPPTSFWDDVYLAAIEAPYGAGHGTVAVLNRIVGALAATIPVRPLWVVRPDEWKRSLGVRGKPDAETVEQLGLTLEGPYAASQDARDALCIAYYARETNARALAS